jgi:hypothetical protein
MFGLMAISWTLWIPASNIPFATNNQEGYCTVFFVGSVLGLIMAIPFGKLLGGWGVALSLLLGDVVTNLWFVFREATRILSLPPTVYLRSTVQRAIIPTAASIVVAILIAQQHIQPASKLVLGGLTTILLFEWMSYCLMWNSQERKAFLHFIASLRM